MENYFVSDSFANALSPLSQLYQNDVRKTKDATSYIVGKAMEYYMLFNGLNNFAVEDMNDYIKKIVNYIVEDKIDNFLFTHKLDQKVNAMLFGDLVKTLNINPENFDETKKRQLRDIIVLALEKKDYKFHSFNGHFLESIKANGIDPKKKENQEEIKEINALFEKYNVEMALGWSKYDDAKVSYSKTPMVSYHYALTSPEWFAQFTGESHWYMDREERFGFENNDYEAAKGNILDLLSKKGFSEEDTEKVMEFFNKNWERYANQKQYVAVLEDPVPSDELKDLVEFYKKTPQYNGSIYELFTLAFHRFDNDIRVPEKLDTSNSRYIEMPKLKELMYKMSEACKKQLTENDQEFDRPR